jgi:GH15 family glucan-1,4-alpha-glucosidase
VPNGESRNFKPISDYGVIGNTRTMALVARNGDIDWLCAPNFDSPPCLYPLLDLHYGGYFRLVAPEATPIRRRYIENTAVLESSFQAPHGRFTVTDFMPVIEEGFAGPNTGLVQMARIVRCEEGSAEVSMQIWPAKGFVHRHKGTDPVLSGYRARYELPDRELMVEVEGCAISTDGRETQLSKRLKEGELFTVLLTFSQPPDLTRHDAGDVLWLQQRTIAFWQQWTSQLSYQGEYRDAVARSAITLKLCQFSASGAIVAAPTTSIPEKLGAEFNWDYRFSWLRDATFTLVALLSLGLYEEALQFTKFIHAAHVKLKSFPVLSTIFGETPLPEIEVQHLSGYFHSKPVRVGNAAFHQLQLDIYGELIHSIDLLLSHSQCNDLRFNFERDLWPVMEAALEDVCSLWRQPDKSIWETRQKAQRFVYSQGMCAVALQRGIEIAKRRHKPVPAHWRTSLQQIKREFHRNAYSRKKHSFVQAYGNEELDASVLRLTLLGRLHPRDHRLRTTLSAIERELMRDGLVLRNKNLDGGANGEGAFLPCSFWFADNLLLTGQVEAGRAMLEKLLSCANDLGLYSEEYEPGNAMMLGNFPQAFTHVALINSAVQLAIASRGHYSESHNIVRGRRRRTSAAPAKHRRGASKDPPRR